MLTSTAAQLFMRQHRQMLFRQSTALYQMQSMTFTRSFRKILLI